MEDFTQVKPKLWHEEFSDNQVTTEPIPDQLLIQLKDEARKILNSKAADYNIKSGKNNSNYQWMKTMTSKGALSDKIAAYIVLIQSSPINNLESLSNVVGMVKVGKKKDCIMAMENLVELFLQYLLPNRKLIPFRQRPLTKLDGLTSGNGSTRKKNLLMWYFEDQLKEVYASFILALNTVSKDTVENNKEKAINAMYKLLSGNPEQEKNLLMYIVNKLGDPSRKVASKSIYCLTQLLRDHSNMQGVVLSEIEKLLFRTNISTRAQYYGLCFLTQFYLCHETSDVARQLIEVYFSFFKACIKKGEVNSRMMSALLMGVNRAYPYAKLEMAKISTHIDTMYRVVHIANFNISLHALSLLYQVSSHSNEINDRFYAALYKKLLDPQISITTHQAMLLSLVYKAIKRDTKINRVKVFIKRLLQLCLYMQPPVACGILYIVAQLVYRNRDLSALILKPIDDIQRDEGENYVDVKDEEEEEKCTTALTVEEPEVLETNNESQDSKDVKPSELHKANINSNLNKTQIKYDGLCRNPLYGGGEFCAYSELLNLRSHFHPTVSLFANNLLKGQNVEYTGDPLKDFSLIRFLDRFVFKNPKKKDEISKGFNHTFGKRKSYIPRGSRSMPVNSKRYINEDIKNIPVDELFLYSYLKRRNNEKPEDNDDSDLESVGSEEFEEMLDKMTGMKNIEDDDLNYMDDVEGNIKSTQKGRNKDAENKDDDDEIGELEEDEDLEAEEDSQPEDFSEDEELNDEDKELMDVTDDEENSDIVFDSDEEVSDRKSKKKLKDDVSSLFASAEEFASLLEDEATSTVAPGGANTWANKDKANVQQIAWEEKRNRWIKDYDRKIHKNKNTKNFKRKPQSSKAYQNKKKK